MYLYAELVGTVGSSSHQYCPSWCETAFMPASYTSKVAIGHSRKQIVKVHSQSFYANYFKMSDVGASFTMKFKMLMNSICKLKFWTLWLLCTQKNLSQIDFSETKQVLPNLGHIRGV